VEDLGRRHAGYGVTDAHYDSVGAALLWTLEQGLGQTWTPAVASAWTEVYGFLSGIMRKATAQAPIAAAKRVAVA
jgi:hemoglobin-like flavoprotein